MFPKLICVLTLITKGTYGLNLGTYILIPCAVSTSKSFRLLFHKCYMERLCTHALFFMKYKRLRAFAYFFTNMTQVGRAIRYFDTNNINKNTLWHIFIHKAQTKSNSKMKFIYPRTHREDSHQEQRSQSWTSWKPSWGSACQFCCWWCGYTFLKSRIRRNVKEKGIYERSLLYI